MAITPYHAKYFAHELTKRCSSDSLEKLSSTLSNGVLTRIPDYKEYVQQAEIRAKQLLKLV